MTFYLHNFENEATAEIGQSHQSSYASSPVFQILVYFTQKQEINYEVERGEEKSLLKNVEEFCT